MLEGEADRIHQGVAAGAAIVRGVLREALARGQAGIDGRRPHDDVGRGRRGRCAKQLRAHELAAQHGRRLIGLRVLGQERSLRQQAGRARRVQVDTLEAAAGRGRQTVEGRQICVDERDRRGQQRLQVWGSLPCVGEEQARLLGEPARCGVGPGSIEGAILVQRRHAAQLPPLRRDVDEQLGRARTGEQPIGLGQQAVLGVEPARSGGRQQRVVGAGARQQQRQRVRLERAGRRHRGRAPFGAIDELGRLQQRRDDARDAVLRARISGVGVDLLHRRELVRLQRAPPRAAAEAGDEVTDAAGIAAGRIAAGDGLQANAVRDQRVRRLLGDVQVARGVQRGHAVRVGDVVEPQRLLVGRKLIRDRGGNTGEVREGAAVLEACHPAQRRRSQIVRTQWKRFCRDPVTAAGGG